MQSQVNASVKMSPELRVRVQNLAKIRSVSAHCLMLNAIESYVDREEKRESFRQAGIKAHNEYMQTGLHLTNNEVLSWLEELSKGNNTEPPICHI